MAKKKIPNNLIHDEKCGDCYYNEETLCNRKPDDCPYNQEPKNIEEEEDDE